MKNLWFDLCFGLVLILSLSFLSACAGSKGAPRMTTLQTNGDGITGGQAVSPQDPLAASVVMISGEGDNGESFICTGAFISPEVILTAGHCVVDDIQKLSVVFGLQPFVDAKVVNLPLTQVIRHPDYKQGGRNDLALLFFSGGLPRHAKVAELDHANLIKNQTSFYAVGYGRTEGLEDSADFSNELGVLRSVQLQAQASQALDSFTIDQTKGKGVCFGDSGGPAFVSEKQKSLVILSGIASGVIAPDVDSGDYCKHSSIYMRVSFYLPWIQSSLQKKAAIPPGPKT